MNMGNENIELCRFKKVKMLFSKALISRKGVILVIVIVIGVFLVTYYYTSRKISDKEFNKIMSSQTELYKSNIKVRDEIKIYEEIHKMANTKIQAEKIVGEVEISEERVNALIIEVTKSDFEDKEILLECLERWKNNDFSQCVKDHNYVWEKLDGEVGMATGLK